MSEHQNAAVLATAALRDIIGLWQQMQAAVIRGDEAEAKRLHQEAHDMLDVYLELGKSAALAVKALHEG